MSRTRVKICGITQREDALAAIAAGADALGLVFYEHSPRAVTVEQALDIVSGLPPMVSVVGLFVDAPESRLEQVIGTVPLDLLQFHGNETPDYCAVFGKPFMKAIRVEPTTDIAREANRYAAGKALLLDAWHPHLMGGTGESFDWDRVPSQLDLPVVLAGGLNAENVTDAIALVQPYAVDVSGGVESEKGIKCHRKIRDFISAVNSTNV